LLMQRALRGVPDIQDALDASPVALSAAALLRIARQPTESALLAALNAEVCTKMAPRAPSELTRLRRRVAELEAEVARLRALNETPVIRIASLPDSHERHTYQPGPPLPPSSLPPITSRATKAAWVPREKVRTPEQQAALAVMAGKHRVAAESRIAVAIGLHERMKLDARQAEINAREKAKRGKARRGG